MSCAGSSGRTVYGQSHMLLIPDFDMLPVGVYDHCASQSDVGLQGNHPIRLTAPG